MWGLERIPPVHYLSVKEENNVKLRWKSGGNLVKMGFGESRGVDMTGNVFLS